MAPSTPPVCPDNSTTCLLYALLDAQTKKNKEFNWDPLSFGFAAPVGVLAFFFTIIAVWQGILSAGAGRFRARPGAIGEFAKFTKSKNNFREFRRSTLARVPFLDEPLWFRGSESLLMRGGTTPRHMPSLEEQLLVDSSKQLAAGWANLLANITGGFAYFGHEKQQDALILCDTDYLPSDIQAAPAVGTIETIVTLAAFAGCDTVDMLGDLPVARGENIQVSFRDHPSLGTVAIFQKFPGQETYTSKTEHSTLARLLEQARLQGIAYQNYSMLSYYNYNDSSPFDVSTLDKIRAGELATPIQGREQQVQTMINLLTSPLLWSRAFPTSALLIPPAARELCLASPGWGKADLLWILAALKCFCTSVDARLLCHCPQNNVEGTGLTPRVPFELYTGEYPSDRNYTNIWDLKANILPPSDSSWLNEQHSKHRVHVLGEFCKFPGIEDQFWSNPTSCVSFGDADPQRIAEKDRSLILLPAAVLASLDWLADPSFWKKLPVWTKALVRGALRYQIHEVDYALATLGQQQAVDDIPKLLDRCISQSAVNHKVQESNSDFRLSGKIPPSKYQSIMKTVEDSKALTPEEGLRALLIFRAVLCGAMFATCADISDVAGTELGRRIVQFL